MKHDLINLSNLHVLRNSDPYTLQRSYDFPVPVRDTQPQKFIGFPEAPGVSDFSMQHACNTPKKIFKLNGL
jgi:hypothetical protein